MTAEEIYTQLRNELAKTVNALLNVRTTSEIHAARQAPGYRYDQNKNAHEYWIALGQYSVAANLGYLSFIINAGNNLLPSTFATKHDIAGFVDRYNEKKSEVIAAFDSVIGKPNIVFIGYSSPISMEEYLNNIVSKIHDEANNLEYNYRKLQG